MGLIARMPRSALLDTARIPVITVVGLQFGQLLAGAVVIEIVFARQRIGFLVVNAMVKRDFPVVQGVILFSALVYVFRQPRY